MKQIRVLDSNGQEYLYPVDKAVAEVSLGRSKSNDIVLSSKAVSRRHAIIKVMGERIVLVNQSANGVLVGNQRVDRVHELALGEFATIDTYQFCVEDVVGQVGHQRAPRRRDRAAGRRESRGSASTTAHMPAQSRPRATSRPAISEGAALAAAPSPPRASASPLGN